MRSVPIVDVDSTEVLDRIMLAKRGDRRERIRAARPEVLLAYRRYIEAAPEVGALPRANLTNRQERALRHAYSVETSPMAALRSSILNRTSVVRCPFCGISESSSLDHYLPKEEYPEFSVFPPNLLPCCVPCNTRKLDRVVLNGTDVRLFMHPHFDDIPSVRFLAARVGLTGDALTLSFRIVRPAGMPRRTFDRIESHFTKLNLGDRYRRMGLEHLGGQYGALSRAYGADEKAERVSIELLRSAEDFEELYGLNYWISVLYRSLADLDAFCDGGFEVIRILA